MAEIVTVSSKDTGWQDATSYEHSPDLGDAHTAWNHLQMVALTVSGTWRAAARFCSGGVLYGPNLPY